MSDAVSRLDSFINVVTGLGSAVRDKTRRVYYGRDRVLSPETLDKLFTNDFARRIVSLVIDDGMRQSFTLELDGGEDAKRADQLMRACQAFDARGKVREAAIWGRLFGGSALYLGIDAGLQRQPFDFAKLQPGALKFVNVLERLDMGRVTYYSDPMSPKLGETDVYMVNRRAGNLGTLQVEVHETRLIMFPGILTTERGKQENDFWDHSALQPVYDVLSSADMNWKAVCHLIADYGQGVFKIKNLMDLISAGREDIVKTRIELIDLARSVVNSVILDADNEDFERKATPIAGVDALLMQTWQRLAAAAEMPVTKLMGVSPAGLNATGENDRASWYDTVQSTRDIVVTPRLNLLVQAIARHIGYADADKWHVCWPSLYQLTAKEESEIYKTRADADFLYLKTGVVTPTEMAIARSAGGTRAAFPKIDPSLERSLPAAPSTVSESTPK